MTIQRNNRGIAAVSIILLGLLALSVVLLDGISISVQKRRAALAQQKGMNVSSYCFRPHEKFPPECSVTSVQRCGQNYLLTSNCVGVGIVVVSERGDFVSWCGYTTIDGEPTSCREYQVAPAGQNCTMNKNICAVK